MLLVLLMSWWSSNGAGPFFTGTPPPRPVASSSAPAAATTREQVLQAAIATEKERLAKRKIAADIGLDAPPLGTQPTVRHDGRTGRGSESAAAKRGRILSREYAMAAFVGCRLLPAGNGTTKLTAHAQPCRHPLPPAAAGMAPLPCHHNLWAGGLDELQQHLITQMNRTQEVRTQTIFERLRDKYYAEPGPDGAPMGRRSWHYTVNGREVCKDTFVAVHGIGASTIEAMQQRILSGRQFAHPKREEGVDKTKAAKVDWKTISVIAWVLAYADEMGDAMPDECAGSRCLSNRLRVTLEPAPDCELIGPYGRLSVSSGDIIIPLRLRLEEWGEYCDERPAEECACYETFSSTLRNAPELRHIKHARKCLNFQHCKVCMNLNGRLRTAGFTPAT